MGKSSGQHLYAPENNTNIGYQLTELAFFYFEEFIPRLSHDEANAQGGCHGQARLLSPRCRLLSLVLSSGRVTMSFSSAWTGPQGPVFCRLAFL